VKAPACGVRHNGRHWLKGCPWCARAKALRDKIIRCEGGEAMKMRLLRRLSEIVNRCNDGDRGRPVELPAPWWILENVL
jgi:hypothetical protein